VLYQATDVVGTLERRFYDFASTSTSRKPSDRIAIIAIDDQSIANIGRWPWPRDVHAELIDKLAGRQGQDHRPHGLLLRAADRPRPAYIRKIKEALGDPAGAPRSRTPGSKVIAAAEQALDTDAKLAASMARAGNVLTPSVFALGEPLGKPDKPLSAAAAEERHRRQRRVLAGHRPACSSRSSRSPTPRPASAT
jgi:hypothetical protein